MEKVTLSQRFDNVIWLVGNLREHLGSSLVFCGFRVAHLFSVVLCVGDLLWVFSCFVLFFVLLCFVSIILRFNYADL
jgi:hypothetical protein